MLLQFQRGQNVPSCSHVLIVYRTADFDFCLSARISDSPGGPRLDDRNSYCDIDIQLSILSVVLTESCEHGSITQRF